MKFFIINNVIVLMDLIDIKLDILCILSILLIVFTTILWYQLMKEHTFSRILYYSILVCILVKIIYMIQFEISSIILCYVIITSSVYIFLRGTISTTVDHYLYAYN